MTIMSKPLLTCGHAANCSSILADGTRYEYACAICDCHTVAENQPDLTGRTAFCAHWGGRCHSTRPSSLALAFFEHREGHDFDRYYCGCWGWN